MAEVDTEFERRQLLKAYRRGLISDELFAEQMAEIGGTNGSGPARTAPQAGRVYRMRDRTYSSERAMLVDFLDEFRAAESFGGVVLSLWTEVAKDAEVRGGLRVVCEREAMHGRALAKRLTEIGGRAQKTLPEKLRESARARLGAREVSDAEKVGDLARRLADLESAIAPIREVIEQIEEDRETRALLEAIVEDEAATIRWFHAMADRLGVDRHARGSEG